MQFVRIWTNEIGEMTIDFFLLLRLMSTTQQALGMHC